MIARMMSLVLLMWILPVEAYTPPTWAFAAFPRARRFRRCKTN